MNLATMRDVASLAGVSTATVSHVVNGTKKISPETVEKVLMAISKVNYQPNTVAKSLRMGQTHTIGVLVEDIRGLPVASIVSGISETLSRNGFRTIFQRFLGNEFFRQIIIKIICAHLGTSVHIGRQCNSMKNLCSWR